MSRPAYSIVIATYERPRELGPMLASVAAQTHHPERVIVVDSSRDDETRRVADAYADKLPLLYERAIEPSAARQRNQGAAHVLTPLVAFIDDDAVLPPDLAEKLCAPFADETTGGVAGRIDEPRRPVPRGLLRWYYRLQAGFDHPTYGGLVFGPAINCYPSYVEAKGDLQPSQWLSSTCVFYRTALFRAEQFPKFDGYSFMEDVHLSARIGKKHRLYFHRDAVFQHHDATSTWKRDQRTLARSRIQNQRRVAREILGFSGLQFEAKLLLHRLFVSVYLLRQRQPGWSDSLLGTWGL